MQNGLEMLGFLWGQLVGLLLMVGVFAGLGVLLFTGLWLLGGGLARWDDDRKEQKALEQAEVDDQDRAVDWDQERQAELREWLEHGIFPSPISRVYPAYQEFTWEWTRLQAHGYQLDHDPVLLDDGQLMVTYSRRPALRIAQ